MTITIDKLFYYIKEVQQYMEEAENNPTLEAELKKKRQQIIDELKSKKQEHSEAIEREILELKKAGKNINPYAENLECSLLHFIVGGLLDVALLKYFEITDMREPSDFLSTAIYHSSIEAIKWLLDNGVSPNGKDEDGDTMLQIALWNDASGEIAKLLIERGVDVNEQNEDGYTALQCAILSHDISIVELLLEKGADVKLKDKHNFSGLDGIFAHCYDVDRNEIMISDDIRLKTLNLLISYGAEITSKEIYKATWHNFQEESSKSKALLLMLGSSQELKIDLNDYSIRQFFTDENNIKALFAVEGYEAQKSIAKENILKSLQEYGQTYNDQKVLDIAQFVSEQEVNISDVDKSEDIILLDQIDYKAELAGDIKIDNLDIADAA